MNWQLRSRRLVLARTFLAVTAAAWGLPALASDPDAERLARFRLDKPTLVKFEAALDGMAEAVKKNPGLVKDGPGKDDPTIADMAAFYNSKPPLRDAIVKAGMTPDSFALCMMSWVQAAMAHGFTQSLPPARRAKAVADAGVPQANVDFVAANKAHLDAVGAKIKALGARR